MSVLPITTRKSSGGAKGLSRASWRRYRALVVCSAVLVVLTLVVDRPGPERHARHDTGKNLPVQDVSSDKSGHPLAHLKSLVLVACHSVYTGLQFEDLEDTSAWALLDYQKSTEGQTHSFIEHILLGVEEAAKDESALLLFSGGKTRGSAGPRTFVHSQSAGVCFGYSCASLYLICVYALVAGMQGIHGILDDCRVEQLVWHWAGGTGSGVHRRAFPG